jgi:hypothetical protein
MYNDISDEKYSSTNYGVRNLRSTELTGFIVWYSLAADQALRKDLAEEKLCPISYFPRKS